MSDDPLTVDKKGKPWLSIGAVGSILTLLVSGAAVFFNQRSFNADVLKEITDRKARDIVTDAHIERMASDITAIRSDVNDALRDPWTGTDTKFWGLEMSRFWSDYAKLNPTAVVPSWPEPKRVRPDDDIRTDSRK